MKEDVAAPEVLIYQEKGSPLGNRLDRALGSEALGSRTGWVECPLVRSQFGGGSHACQAKAS